MANKRQRKKQQTKKNIEILKKAGYSKKDIKRLKNQTETVRKIERQYKRNERAKRRYQELIGYGIDKKQARRMRYWSEEKYQHYLKEFFAEQERKKREEEKRKKENEKYLLIFWREKTNNFFDEDVISKMKHSLKYVKVPYLIKGIQDLISTPPEHAIIGSALTVVTPKKQKNQLIRFYKNFDDGTFQSFNSYFLVYEGKAGLQRYRELLVNIYTVLSLMYELTAKYEFMQNLIFRDLPQVNQKTAERLAHDLQWRRK